MLIGLFGGSFNPVHHCHLSVASQTRDRLGLDRVVFIPSGDPPHKASSALAPAAHRVEMVRRAIATDPSFVLSEVEVQRDTKSYTIDTICELREQYGAATDFYFIIGLDAFLDFPTWREPERLLTLCHFVVVSRPGSSFASLSSMPLLPAMSRDSLIALDAHDHERLEVRLAHDSTLILLALPPCATSASDIRNRLQQGRRVSSLLPASVESYIIQLRLYLEGSDRSRVKG